MSQIPGAERKGTRSWKIAGLWVDLLGELTTYGSGQPAMMETPVGEVVMLTVEELLAERVFAARKWTGFNAADDQCVGPMTRREPGRVKPPMDPKRHPCRGRGGVRCEM